MNQLKSKLKMSGPSQVSIYLEKYYYLKDKNPSQAFTVSSPNPVSTSPQLSQQQDNLIFLSRDNKLVNYSKRDNSESIEQKFARYFRMNTVQMKICQGNYACSLISEGDLIVFNLATRFIHTIQGFSGFSRLFKSTNQNLEVYIDQKLRSIMLFSPNLDYTFVWIRLNQSKDEGNWYVVKDNEIALISSESQLQRLENMCQQKQITHAIRISGQFLHIVKGELKSHTDDNSFIDLTHWVLKIDKKQKHNKDIQLKLKIARIKQMRGIVQLIKSPQDTLLLEIDNQGSLLGLIVNSPHLFFCQYVFVSLEQYVAVSQNLFPSVTPDDSPPFDKFGKTNLQISSLKWTHDDQYLIITFKQNSFSLISRLGGLIEFLNPTLSNLNPQTMDVTKYSGTEKKFNELIAPKQFQEEQGVSQKIEISSVSDNNQFILYNGYQMFIFKLEIPSQISQIDSILDQYKDNKEFKSFLFLRSALAQKEHLNNPEVLGRIPQLMSSKLPQFEYEKNQELDENEDDDGNQILTASQINPYTMPKQTLETNQSFSVEFSLDCETVLRNLKLTLVQLLWGKEFPLNYQKWVISIINDSFFYFLKNNEPLHAYHCLKISETVLQQHLFHSKAMPQTLTQDQTLTQSLLGVKFLYSKRERNTNQALATQDPLYYKELDTTIDLERGGAMKTELTQNYTLLVYYCLIQFRNYQSNNFNILFLVFACYVIQHHSSVDVLEHIQQIVRVIHKNHECKEKSDEYEMFLGKSGKNVLQGVQNFYEFFLEIVKQKTESETTTPKLDLYKSLVDMIDNENIEVINDTCLESLFQNIEKCKKNALVMQELGFIYDIVLHIQTNNLDQVLSLLKQAKLKIVQIQEGNMYQAIHNYYQGLSLLIDLFVERASKNGNPVDLQGTLVYHVNEVLENFYKVFLGVSDAYSMRKYIKCTHQFDSLGPNLKEFDLNQEITEQKIPQSLYNFIILGLFQLGRCQEALKIMEDFQMKGDHFLSDVFIVTCILKTSYKRIDQYEQGTPVKQTEVQYHQNLISSILDHLKRKFYKQSMTSVNCKLFLSLVPINLRIILIEGYLYQNYKKVQSILRKYLKFDSQTSGNITNMGGKDSNECYLNEFISYKDIGSLDSCLKNEKECQQAYLDFQKYLLHIFHIFYDDGILIFDLNPTLSTQFSLVNDVGVFVLRTDLSENEQKIKSLLENKISKIVRLLYYLKTRMKIQWIYKEYENMISLKGIHFNIKYDQQAKTLKLKLIKNLLRLSSMNDIAQDNYNRIMQLALINISSLMKHSFKIEDEVITKYLKMYLRVEDLSKQNLFLINKIKTKFDVEGVQCKSFLSRLGILKSDKNFIKYITNLTQSLSSFAQKEEKLAMSKSQRDIKFKFFQTANNLKTVYDFDSSYFTNASDSAVIHKIGNVFGLSEKILSKFNDAILGNKASSVNVGDESIRVPVIKGVHLAQNFMRGRQAGRAETPTATGRKQGLANKAIGNLFKDKEVPKPLDDTMESTRVQKFERSDSIDFTTSRVQNLQDLQPKAKRLDSVRRKSRDNSGIIPISELKSPKKPGLPLPSTQRRTTQRSKNMTMHASQIQGALRGRGAATPIAQQEKKPVQVLQDVVEKARFRQIREALILLALNGKETISADNKHLSTSQNIQKSPFVPRLNLTSAATTGHKKNVRSEMQKPFSLMVMERSQLNSQRNENSTLDQIQEEVKIPSLKEKSPLKPTTTKAFEIIRVKDKQPSQSLSQIAKPPLSPSPSQREGGLHQIRESTQNKGQVIVKKRQRKKKDQYNKFMNKFKEMSEKIAKVQRDAVELEKEYSRIKQ